MDVVASIRCGNHPLKHSVRMNFNQFWRIENSNKLIHNSVTTLEAFSPKPSSKEPNFLPEDNYHAARLVAVINCRRNRHQFSQSWAVCWNLFVTFVGPDSLSQSASAWLTMAKRAFIEANTYYFRYAISGQSYRFSSHVQRYICRTSSKNPPHYVRTVANIFPYRARTHIKAIMRCNTYMSNVLRLIHWH